MEDARAVRGCQAPAQVARDLERLVLGKAADPLQERGEVLAVDVLHAEEVLAVHLADVEHPAHARVGDLPREADLLVEAGERGAVPREGLRQELEGHRLAELQVVGAVHLAHPAAAEQAHHSITTPEHGARRVAPAIGGRRRVGRGRRLRLARLGRAVVVEFEPSSLRHAPSLARVGASDSTWLLSTIPPGASTQLSATGRLSREPARRRNVVPIQASDKRARIPRAPDLTVSGHPARSPATGGQGRAFGGLTPG